MLGAILLGGCGTPSPTGVEPAPGSPGGVVEVVMTDYHFAPDPVPVRAGRVRFRVVNGGTVAHDFTVLTQGGHSRLARSGTVQPGSSVTLAADLAIGKYPVACTQPGHQELGMEATIVAS